MPETISYILAQYINLQNKKSYSEIYGIRVTAITIFLKKLLILKGVTMKSFRLSVLSCANRNWEHQSLTARSSNSLCALIRLFLVKTIEWIQS